MILRAGSVMTYRKKCRNVDQSITGKERGKWKIMRNRFDRQLQVLNDELIEMGSLIEHLHSVTGNHSVLLLLPVPL